MKRNYFLTFLLALITGCSAPVQDDIPGQYEYKDKYVEERIVIAPDGTYSMVSLAADDQINLKGRWKFSRIESSCARIIFMPFNSNIRYSDGNLLFSKENDYWDACLYRGLFGGIYIGLDFDLNLNYRKK